MLRVVEALDCLKMNQGRPLFLKTYGKQHRKIDAWISPVNRKRKQLFESTTTSVSNDSNDSISHSKVTKTRGVRHAKSKALKYLKVEDTYNDDEEEEDVFVPLPLRPTQQNNKPVGSGRGVRRRGQGQVQSPHERETESSPGDENNSAKRRKVLARGKKSLGVRHAKSKAMKCLKVEDTLNDDEEEEEEEDDDDVFIPLPLRPTQQNNKPVGSGRGVRRRGQQGQVQSPHERETESSPGDENNSAKRRKVLARGKKSVAAPPSVSRFVTRRRGAAAPRPKRPRAPGPALVPLHSLNSSDDFAVGRGVSTARWVPRLPRRKAAPYVFSSAENSTVSEAENTSSASNPFLRDISLVESTCPRKPLFCSTPSAGPRGKRPHLETHPVNRQPSPSVSTLASAGVLCLSSSQEEPSPDIQSAHNQERLTSVRADLPSNSRTGEEPEDNSGFVSAEEGLEWLVEGLKERCLTQQCSVKLKRVVKLTASQFLGLTTYSSCLDDMSTTDRLTSVGGGQTPDHSLVLIHGQTIDRSLSCVEIIDHSQTADNSQSVNDCDSIDHAGPVTADRSTDLSQAVDHTASGGLSNDQSMSVVCVESDHHVINSDESTITDSGSEENGHCTAPITNSGSEESGHCTAHTQSAGPGTEERAPSMLKEICLSKKLPTVQPRRMTSLELDLALGGITQSRQSGLVSDGQSVICAEPAEESEVGQSTVDIDHLASCTRSDNKDERKQGLGSEGTSPQGETVEILTTGVPTGVPTDCVGPDTQSIDNRRFVDADNGALKNCLTKKCTVQVKRVSSSELTQRLKVTTLPSSPHDLSSASEGGAVDGTWSGSEPESEPPANPDPPSRLRRSMRPKKEAKERVVIPGDVPPKGKKASLAPEGKRRRSVSRDRPGTTRKACVKGLSVSRWKDRSNTSGLQGRSGLRGGSGAGDCSITELLSSAHNKPTVSMGSLLQGSAAICFTPVQGRTSQRLNISSLHHNISSLLADIPTSPSKHTWSRLKAALSVHRKTKAFITPRRQHVLDSPGGAGLLDFSQDLFTTPIRKSLPRRLQSQLVQSTSQSAHEEDDLSDAEKVYAECGQEGLLSWEECILPQQMKRCKKIGEGTFGEVFSTTNASGVMVALKIIPVEGDEKVNGEDQKTFGEILHEIIISKELSSLKGKQHNQTHGFIGLNNLHCARGCYPPALLKAWDAFDRQKGSENDRPDFFEEDQLFLILEFEFGGSDLENSNGTLASLVTAKTILHQVTAALAVAEQELCFEHRDLHWGNVLVKTTREKKASFLLNGSNHSLETKGVHVRIIDYSLSRLEIDELTVSCDISEDEELFMGQGDYQFDIYRLMRQENGNNWADYQPHSNVLWLHYLSCKLLSMKYRQTGGRGIKDVREELTCFHDNVLQYRSATEALQNALLFKK